MTVSGAFGSAEPEADLVDPEDGVLAPAAREERRGVRHQDLLQLGRVQPLVLVAAVVGRIEAGERFYLVVTPEGTRGKGRYWKSGFLRIATAANLPITLGYVDNPTRTTGLGLTFTPSGDVRADHKYAGPLAELYAARNRPADAARWSATTRPATLPAPALPAR